MAPRAEGDVGGILGGVEAKATEIDSVSLLHFLSID